jgi:phosphoribosylformylglycinamidine (FGAM) synthase-like amidotransferase family enzyme
MSTIPNVLVLTGFGLNCDHETAYAFELAGATATRAHINTLIAGDISLDDFQILAFGGRFQLGGRSWRRRDSGLAPENEHRR